MDFGDVVARRRMVRSYLPTPVARDVLERILDRARRGPSAGHTQGQTFVVVTDAPLRRAVADLCGEEGYATRGFPRWLSTAPVHVVVCTSAAAYTRRYTRTDKDAPQRPAGWRVPYWWVDAGAAFMLLLLAAVDEGLAAGFLDVPDADGLRRLLAIPPDVDPLGVVTLGHAGGEDRPSRSLQLGRRPFADQVRWQRW